MDEAKLRKVLNCANKNQNLGLFREIPISSKPFRQKGAKMIRGKLLKGPKSHNPKSGPRFEENEQEQK